MKIFFLICLFSIIPYFTFSQRTNFPSIYVEIDPENCASCIKSLDNVKEFEDADQPYFFVLKEEYKSEKKYFQKKYRLQNLKAEYIWNDSLYNFLHTQPGSSVSLVSSAGVNRMAVPVTNFNSAIARYFLKKCKLTDTLHYDHEILSPLINKMEFSRNTLYSLNRLRKEAINVVNINNGQISQLTLTDSLSKHNFLHNFNSLNEWKQAAYIELPNNNEFDNFQVVNDTVFAVSRHNYIAEVKGEDTGVASFYAMNVFVKGQFQKSYKIDPMSIYPEYYWIPDFNYYNGVFYFSTLKPKANHSERPSFIAEYKPEGDELVFQKYFDMTLPPEMPLTSNFVPAPYFQKDYFLISLDHNLYRLNKDSSLMSLPQLDNGKVTLQQLGREHLNYLAPPFRIDRHYLWFNYYPKGSKQLVSVKYDLKTQKMVDCREMDTPFLTPIFDDFDYNYVYIPIDNKTIVRTHLSTLKKQN